MKHRWLLKKFFLSVSKLSLIVILWLGSVYAFDAINKTHIFNHTVTTNVHADGNINIWWPTNGAHIDNTQAFKAQVQDKNVDEYTMTWSVDNGQENSMYDSSTDYPHKEAMVDLKNWTWKGSGPYKVTIRAIDKNNNPLGESSVDIYLPEPAAGPTEVASFTEKTLENSKKEEEIKTEIKSSLSKIREEKQKVTALWPTDKAEVQGTTDFKARVEDRALSSYNMYWQVDNGQYNPMTPEGDIFKASVDVTHWGWKENGEYTINFVAEDEKGKTLAHTEVLMRTKKVVVAPSNTTVEITPVESVQPKTSPVAEVISPSGNPFAGAKLWINTNSDARRTADAWRSSRPQDAYQMDKIAQNPDVIWLGGWNSDISGFVKDKVSEVKSQGALPVFIAYNIPERDCGQYSSGGVGSAEEYRGWIRKIADAIGSNKAVVVLEPDATTLTECLGSRAGERFSLLSDAVTILKSKPQIGVYIDAGHSGWISPETMASRLQQSGIARADGFSLNISNFQTTQSNIEYGTQISNKISGKHFIIDTGRNGLGPTSSNEWCNPSGRALGQRPTTNTGNNLVDAFLWVKGPGGSDGNCNGGPNAGVWWPEYALDMARRSAN